MIVLDASVSLKWFVPGEPLAAEAAKVLDAIAEDPRPYAVPELFMNEVLAVLARLPGATRDRVSGALALIESLGLARIGNGHDLLSTAAAFACDWGVTGFDAVYLAAAALGDGVWLTADARAARKVQRTSLVHLLGR